MTNTNNSETSNQTHKIDCAIDSDGRYMVPTTLIIKGASNRGGPGGWGVCGWDATASGRVETGGPEIQGPRASLFGKCSVIDNHGGTGADHQRLAGRGLLVHVTPGDIIEVDGVSYKVSLDVWRYPALEVA